MIHSTSTPRQEAVRRLVDSSYPELRTISCDFSDGVLSLRGKVPSFYLKQIAQSLVFPLDGVAQLRNGLEVST